VSVLKKVQKSRERRAMRVRSKLSKDMPRVSVFRSTTHFYAQVIDDKAQQTVASCSTLELEKLKGTKSEKAFAVGKELARRALEKGIHKIAFDRGRFLFHGRVKAFADGLKEGGLHL
jgi:large subunit ribosomal protein L18